MADQYTCSRGHHWGAPGDAFHSGEQTAYCPVCGEANVATSGSPASTGSIAVAETLSPDFTPPVIQPLATISFQDAWRSAYSRPSRPERIGNYEILAEIGRGGMGVVYKARHEQLGRFVAIKMILAGTCAGPEVIHRFRAEAEAVARLQHPHIVQIHDVGEYEGRQYLVLEYLDGGSLARASGRKPQRFRLAAEIVELLSRAIGYAHRKGIIHRDLTPANVLLTAPHTDSEKTASNAAIQDSLDLRTIVLKITDFGLAKRLDDAGEFTRTGAVMGTPCYMAPEQASGQSGEAGPSVDIYALGAILYELLTGRPPFLAETAIATLEQVVRQDPVPPARFQPRLPRDLETICLKCLEKDPARRYATADELADDLGRFLNDEPIVARRSSPVVRVLRWSRRRPSAAALIVVSLLAVLALLGGSSWYSARVLWERDRAEENLRLALSAVDRMLTEVGEEQLAYEPRMERKRRALLQKALALYQEFLKQKRDDPRLRLETAQAQRRMGDVERWLGNHIGAAVAYRAAIGMIKQLLAEQPTNAEYGRWLGYCYNYLGEAQRHVSQTAEAEAAYRSAMRLQQQLSREFPDQWSYAQDLARSYYNAGILFRETNRAADAEGAFNRAIELLKGVAVGKQAVPPSARQELARAYINLGPVLRATQRHDQAIEVYAQALDLLEGLAREYPDRPEYRLELAVARANRGNLRQTIGEKEQARNDYNAAISRLRQLVDDHPGVPVLRQELANTFNSLAAMQSSIDGLAMAEQTWSEAATLLRELVVDHGSLPVYHGDLGMTLGNLGWSLARQEKFAAARERLREGIAELETALAANPEQPDYIRSLRSQLQELGHVSVELGDHAAAADAARRLVDVAGDLPGDAVVAACLLARSASLADQDTEARQPDGAEMATRYDEQATALIRTAVAGGFDDAQLLEQTKAYFAERLQKNAGLREAYSLLEERMQVAKRPK